MTKLQTVLSRACLRVLLSALVAGLAAFGASLQAAPDANWKFHLGVGCAAMAAYVMGLLQTRPTKKGDHQ